MIESVTVQTLGGDTIKLGDVLADVAPQNSDGPVVMSCLSHYGDYNAWELTQQYVSALKEGRLTNSPVVLVSIGSVQAAQTFANDIGVCSLLLTVSRVCSLTLCLLVIEENV
jgi:hypothetical protein